MGEVRLFCDEFIRSSTTVNKATCIDEMSSTHAETDQEFDRECTRSTTGNWSEALSSLSNVNAKLVWKSGTEKLSQTFNNFKTTFGVISQRIRKSAKRRKPLINIDSPRTPVTPYTRSKVSLGRTPTKLYSPFHIDTPAGKENDSSRMFKHHCCAHGADAGGGTKKPKRTKLNLDACDGKNQLGEALLEVDMLETQIGIYEFQSVANRIVRNVPRL